MIRPLTVTACLIAACSRPAPAEPPHLRERDPSTATAAPDGEPPSRDLAWSEPPPTKTAPALTPLRDVSLALDPGPAPKALRLHTAAEGACPWLDVSLLGPEVFLHWRLGTDLARMLPNGGLESLELPPAVRGRPSGRFRIDHVGGSWPDDLWVHFEDDVTRLSRLNDYKPSYAWRQRGVWSTVTDPRAAPQQTVALRAERMYPWPNGAILAQERGYIPTFRLVRGAGEAPTFPELKARQGQCVHTQSSLQTFASGALVMVGQFCRKQPTIDAWNLVASRWTAGRGVVDVLPHPPGKWSRSHKLAAPAPDRYHVAADFTAGPNHAAYTMLTSFEGEVWSAPVVFAGWLSDLAVDRDGAPWLVISGDIHRRASDGSWERMLMTPPGKQPLHVQALGGLDGEVAWLQTSGGALWLRPEGGAFSQVIVPAPIVVPTAQFKIEAPKLAGRDVWIPAYYYYQNGTGPEALPIQHRALLRTGPARPTLRCTAAGGLGP